CGHHGQAYLGERLVHRLHHGLVRRVAHRRAGHPRSLRLDPASPLGVLLLRDVLPAAQAPRPLLAPEPTRGDRCGLSDSRCIMTEPMTPVCMNTVWVPFSRD